jgi:hypothetical protein
MHSDRITNWGMGAERASKTASFTHILYCDTITTQIVNCSNRFEITNMWNRPKNRGFSAVQLSKRVKPVAMVPVRFQPGPGTELPIWNRCYHYWQLSELRDTL